MWTKEQLNKEKDQSKLMYFKKYLGRNDVAKSLTSTDKSSEVSTLSTAQPLQ